MGKHERIRAEVESRKTAGKYPVCYELFFSLFNGGDYYEAHDVLEYLWLECTDSHAVFYKGLIQIAGAFVHMRKQFLRPDHPKDGKRLRPATRLLNLGSANVQPFGPHCMGLDVEALCAMCRETAGRIVESDYRTNPWTPETGPQIQLS